MVQNSVESVRVVSAHGPIRNNQAIFTEIISHSRNTGSAAGNLSNLAWLS
ncbi:UNVERIFIED_CONTAM: hypothetical protein ABIE34_000939 [Jeotgalibacillus campisalis]